MKKNKLKFLGNKGNVFNYSYDFSLTENTLHDYRDSIPLPTQRQRNKEMIELYKFLFEKELRKFLNKSNPNKLCVKQSQNSKRSY